MRNLIIVAILIIFSAIGCNTKNYKAEEAAKEREELRATAYSQKLMLNVNALSERVSLVAYVPDDELFDGSLDDESDIIYIGKKIEGSDFLVEEFLEFDIFPSEETLRKIKDMHIPELQKVRDNLNLPIIIRSAARTVEWEKKEGGLVSPNTYSKMDSVQ